MKWRDERGWALEAFTLFAIVAILALVGLMMLCASEGW